MKVLRMQSPVLWAAVATASVLALSACSGSGSGSSNATSSNTSVTIGTPINTLDPVLADTVQNDMPSDVLYDQLIDYNEQGQVVPRLATSWTIAPDARSITFTLRANAKFHDGTVVTAKDVVYTINRIKALGVGVASLISDVASAKANGADQVVVSLTAPNSIALGAFSKVYILDSALVAQHEGSDHAQAWLASHDAGSGPYTLAAYTPQTSAKFTLNPKYWSLVAGRPKTLVFTTVALSSTVRDDLTTGTLDIGQTLSPSDLKVIQANSSFNVLDIKSAYELYVYFNTKLPALSDPRVREAISLAYDYKDHLATFLGGHGAIATGPLPSSMGCRQVFPASSQNITMAKQLLSEAGVTHLSLTMVYQPNLDEMTRAATLLQSNLNDIGITLKLQTTTFPAYLQSLKSASTTPDMAILYDGAAYPDPGVMLQRTFSSSTIGQGSNYGNYSNPQVDALISSAIADPNEATRCAKYKEIQTIVHNDYVAADMMEYSSPWVVRKGITGLVFSPVHQIDPLALRVS